LPDLGVAANLEEGAGRLAAVLAAHPPGLIYLPHPEDGHPDHEAALPLVRAALRQAFRKEQPELRAYEVWTPMARYDWPEDISRHMGRKLRAVRCYRSQLRVFRYDRAVRGLNQYRGTLAGRCRLAEVFRYIPAEPSGPGLALASNGVGAAMSTRNCLILGSGRSGTSMLAGMLRLAGYYMGEHLVPADPSNPKGYFEDDEVNAINEELLSPVTPPRSHPAFGWRWLAAVP